jgi:hypothetical protein
MSVILLSSCLRSRETQLSGRVTGRDSAIVLRLSDRHVRFRVTNNVFSGKIHLREGAYVRAHFLPSYRGMLLFLTPGKHLEITVNAPPTPPLFAGSLAAINNYLSEQEDFLALRPHVLRQDEETFVESMEERLRVKNLLLEAKNLGSEFTTIESERIGYLAAEYALRYALARSRLPAPEPYRPGARLRDFISRFPVDNERMADVDVFLQFVLAYYSFEMALRDNIREVTTEIVEQVKVQKIKDHLLSELIYRHIYQRGIKDGEYLLSLCRQEMRDTARIMKIERVAERWRKLSAGATAPDVTLRDANGNHSRLREMRGHYLYVVADHTRGMAWTEDSTSLRAIREHAGKNIRFLHLIFDPSLTFTWKERARENEPWEHFLVENWREFYDSYVISSFPRYFFIDPRGRFVTALASPSENLFMHVHP